YSYIYDQSSGRLSSVTDPAGGTLSYTYDGFLQLSETSTGEVSGTVSRTVDAFLNLASTSVNGGSTINLTYDNDKLLIGAGALSLTRDAANGALTGTTLGVVSTSIAHNTFGESTSYSATSGGSAIFTNSYVRDKLGRITERTETIDGLTKTYAYTYDIAGRLTEVTQDGLSIGAYTYDDNGNRTSFTGQAGSLAGIYDNQDRLLSYGTASYTYSANGELESKTDAAGTTDYYYDVLGNLMSTVLPDSTQIDYVIDAKNRRVGKKINGALTKGFLYSGSLNPVAELDGAGNVVSRFVYGDRANVPSYMIKGGNTYRIISDHLGSPRVVIDSATGTVAQRMDFDEFGNVTLDTNPGFQPFGFAGGIYDLDTKLTRFGARDYDAYSGRWTAKDPINFAGGDTNLYGYVLNDPVNFVDPNGLKRDCYERLVQGLRGVAQLSFGAAGALVGLGLAPPSFGTSAVLIIGGTATMTIGWANIAEAIFSDDDKLMVDSSTLPGATYEAVTGDKEGAAIIDVVASPSLVSGTVGTLHTVTGIIDASQPAAP
ncbi:MAG: RHS repeat-associated core domain-containing protein, partial [Thermodesulfobacteriota bacterium]